jgi:hypothetical protein
LQVQQWRIDPDDDEKRRKRKVLGMLIPENETKLKIIGQWLVDPDQPSEIPPKGNRAHHLNECGFT